MTSGCWNATDFIVFFNHLLGLIIKMGQLVPTVRSSTAASKRRVGKSDPFPRRQKDTSQQLSQHGEEIGQMGICVMRVAVSEANKLQNTSGGKAKDGRRLRKYRRREIKSEAGNEGQ